MQCNCSLNRWISHKIAFFFCSRLMTIGRYNSHTLRKGLERCDALSDGVDVRIPSNASSTLRERADGGAGGVKVIIGGKGRRAIDVIK